MIERLCIIGVGLIGGSLARALRDAGAVQEVVGAGRQLENLQTAVDLGVIDRYHTDLAQAVAGADMVVVCVPLGAIEGVFYTIKDHLDPQAVLTDVGSAKGSVIDAAKRAFRQLPDFFVPGHPIAGTELSGVEASFAGLFHERRVILTPLAETRANAIDRVREMWQAAGAQVVSMDAVHHDVVLAATSHLPHLLAFSLVDTLARLDEHNEIFDYAAGGFRDFTRIASSDPVMWRDICLANGDAIQLMIEQYIQDLQVASDAIGSQDGQQLLELFMRAKAARDQYIKDQQGQD